MNKKQCLSDTNLEIGKGMLTRKEPTLVWPLKGVHSGARESVSWYKRPVSSVEHRVRETQISGSKDGWRGKGCSSVGKQIHERKGSLASMEKQNQE